MNTFDTLIEQILSEEGFIDKALGLGLSGALALSTPAMAHTKSPKPAITKKVNRGIQNNNPGNLRSTGNWKEWGGAIGSDGAFIKFRSPEYGIRAIGKLLKSYQTRYNLNTIHDIINRWAPSNENDTQNYIDEVSSWTGIDPHVKLNLNNKATMKKLIDAIVKRETSHKYPNGVVERGIDLIKVDY